ncbi:hypothetical protein [Aquisalibacillus elongatus]|uniref:Uncharacterized protein n=1 Tax=Aquisalibacillus elongatus TaxID=485577 RepID=A0A3N5BZK4_9BACI|nr:hypothetical protein [Aquisalibacillus elongatus]RPF55258.1 hypothetical protein EDC24_0129 [Aquisalibacillus elongatus]
MSENSSKEIINVDVKDMEVIDAKKTGSVGETIVKGTGKAIMPFIPVIVEYTRQRLTYDLETQNQVRNDKRSQLNKRAESLLKLIDKEEAKENFEQRRIDRWCEELEEIWRKLDTLDAKSDGFVKVMLNKLFKNEKN